MQIKETVTPFLAVRLAKIKKNDSNLVLSVVVLSVGKLHILTRSRRKSGKAYPP